MTDIEEGLVEPSNSDLVVQSVPEPMLQAIDRDVEAAGGEWQEPTEYEGSIGRTMFDTPSSTDGTVTALTPKDNIELLPRQSLVRIRSVADQRSYLGAVVEGPFAEPDGLRADAPIMVAVTVRGALMLPKYHGRAQVEILGEELEDGSVVPPRRRPLPNSPIFLLSSEEAEQVLRTGGEVCVGVVVGQEDIEVRVPAASKAVLPRHLGILGTTGGGKSTTVSGLVAQLQRVGVACVLLDTEGEYTAMCDPTNDAAMVRALTRRGREPAGVQDTCVYHLVGRETANPGHPRSRPFSLRFSELSPYAVMEILDLTDAQQERFLKAYDATKLVLDRLGIYPKNDKQRNELLELDELERGYLGMTLTHLHDMISVIAAWVANPDVLKGDLKAALPHLRTAELWQQRDKVAQVIAQAQLPKMVTSWWALQGRVGRVRRLDIFDNPAAQPLFYDKLLTPGRVSIIDLSDTDSPQVSNLVIAEILRGVQGQQESSYRKATAEGRQPTPVMVFIEEAHEFLSQQRIKQMGVLFQQVARIARRGRKRWLGLAFVTQLPQHLPDEALGLINNWVLHKINDANVVNRLRRSIGGIDQALWGLLPSLSPGQAIVSFTSLTRPVLVAVDPTPCRLLMVE
jgi:uncharacterized protein